MFNMKNKALYLTLLIMTSLIFASCAGNRGGYGNQRKGYGCPNTASIQTPAIEKSKV
jgi:hypothetical protein